MLIMIDNLDVGNGYGWSISIDGENYSVETNLNNKNEAIREGIIACSGRADWSQASFSKFRTEHRVKVIGGPIRLNRRAICTKNGDFN